MAIFCVDGRRRTQTGEVRSPLSGAFFSRFATSEPETVRENMRGWNHAPAGGGDPRISLEEVVARCVKTKPASSNLIVPSCLAVALSSRLGLLTGAHPLQNAKHPAARDLSPPGTGCIYHYMRVPRRHSRAARAAEPHHPSPCSVLPRAARSHRCAWLCHHAHRPARQPAAALTHKRHRKHTRKAPRAEPACLHHNIAKGRLRE